ncbi:phage portal protein [Melghirimyces algeriensis]|uniref:phage portal protein n=1 Tax=Melghirimyces algeriensis TaxID=910412 RepID=UPI00163DC4D5|nr:phage portal protein [Melghirimyces algeriensis]
MKEKRSLFDMIFGRRPQQQQQIQTQLRMLNGYAPVFTSFSGDAYDSDVVRSAVDAIARNAAKLKPKHVRRVRRANDGIQETGSEIEKLLSVRPNPYMDAYTFYYKAVTQLYMQNNSFIFIDIDRIAKKIRGFYPINAATAEFLEFEGDIYTRFHFMGGQQITLPYEDLIHLRRFFYKHDLYGEPSDRALHPTLQLIQTTDEGIANAVKSSAFLRGILKFTSMLKPEDMKKQRDMFVADYLDITNNGGVAATDAKTDYTPLDNEPKMIDDKQMDAIKRKVFDYFGINETIIRSNYSEDEWNAFYESTIEPLAIQMSLEFTSKLFTDAEKKRGNEIIFEANRLQYASMTTKLNLREMVDRGAMTPNEWRAALNLAPIEGGDAPIRRLDTAEVNTEPTTGGDDNEPGEEGTPSDGDPGGDGAGAEGDGR